MEVVWPSGLGQQDLGTLKKVWIDVRDNNLFTNSIKADREI